MNNPKLRSHIALLGVAMLPAVAPAAQADLKLSVHPFKPPTKLIESFSPLANYLSEKLGEPVILQITKGHQALIDAAREGKGATFSFTIAPGSALETKGAKA